MLTTMVVVAAVARAALGFSWPAAFVLGAVLAPTDPLAATSILRRLSVPRRIVTIVEAESLFNDGTALVAYRAAVAAVTAGAFSISDTLFRVVWTVALGVAIGLAVGWIAAQVRLRLDDPPTEIAISLITPYLAYLPADATGASGVLAVLTVGLYLGWRTPLLVSPTTRIQTTAAWEVLVFALNATLFVLIGLQLPTIISALHGFSALELVRDAFLA